MMKRILFIIFCLALPACVSATEKSNESRVLVLGFDLPGADTVQRRFIREEVMRELSGRGESVVPVMELEEHFLGENAVPEESSLSDEIVQNWAGRVPSAAIVSGRCEKTAGGVWNIYCTFYLVKDRKYVRKTIRTEGSSLPDTKFLAGEILRILHDPTFSQI